MGGLNPYNCVTCRSKTMTHVKLIITSITCKLSYKEIPYGSQDKDTKSTPNPICQTIPLVKESIKKIL